jgi:hypothetical protein
MHYSQKISSSRMPLRKVAAALLDRRSYPAWIDADSGIAFSAASSGLVTARVRDSLVLRLVAKRKNRTLSDERSMP